MTLNEEALKLAKRILSDIQENKSVGVTNLLRRCARITELLNLDEKLWINNELKGYPDDDVPPYRLIEVQCHNSWRGSLPMHILGSKMKELFYKNWIQKIVIQDSSVLLESWARKGNSIELEQTTISKIKVRKVANVKSEQYWEILHRILDKIREFASNIEIKLADQITIPKSDKKVIAFLSASFSNEIDPLISSFINIIRALDIDVIWLKEKYQSRPTEEKIKENIWLCNSFIQIITKNVIYEGKEAGWPGNEIAWAKDSTPNGNMVIFVEKGVKASGLASVIVDNLPFDTEKIIEDIPKIIQYLNDLKRRVIKEASD